MKKYVKLNKPKWQLLIIWENDYYKIFEIGKYSIVNNFSLSIKILTILSLIFLIAYYLYNDSTTTKSLNDTLLSKYQNMLPHLNYENNNIPSSIEDIFKARQLYISDVKITSDYIRYVRPINKIEEQKYKYHYSKNESINIQKLFEKKEDKYEFIEFCKLALEEKLINDNENFFYSKPIISIVIPSYNKQDILMKSVRSIQNQNFKNIEIIIVNDCSTDNSSKIFNYLLEKDSRIRIFHHIKNLGLFRSRLDGILYSRGKYIIAFDAGDLYEDNYVLLDSYNIMKKYNFIEILN